MKHKKSLHQCSNARVNREKREWEAHIYCVKGHLFAKGQGGVISIIRLERGDPLELSVCQYCRDYEEMGPPIPKEERGWRDQVAATL